MRPAIRSVKLPALPRATWAGMRSWIAPTLATLLALAPAALAEDPGSVGAPADALPVSVKTHDPAAARVIRSLLGDPAYWEGAWRRTYTGRSYDEIRMRELDRGFLPMITGEGQRDVPQDVIEEVIFEHFVELPAHLAPAERVVNLGQGHDPTVGADYSDTWFFFDVPFMYIELTWRLYRMRDASGASLLWFEKLTPAMAGPATWTRYQARIDAARETVDRKALFGNIVEPSEVYGLFRIAPGEVHESRVTFVAHVHFGPETGWLASQASQIALFLRTALAQAFDAAVAISVARVEGATVSP